jgi:tetratricopeptide (TPR) repeat protein
MLAVMISPTIPRIILAASLFAAAPQAMAAPSAAIALIDQAHAAQTRGETELALRLAQSAIVADPRLTNAYVALGDLYASAGQADYARNYYDEALEIDPADPGALKAIAVLDNKTPRVIAKP